MDERDEPKEREGQELDIMKASKEQRSEIKYHMEIEMVVRLCPNNGLLINTTSEIRILLKDKRSN